MARAALRDVPERIDGARQMSGGIIGVAARLSVIVDFFDEALLGVVVIARDAAIGIDAREKLALTEIAEAGDQPGFVGVGDEAILVVPAIARGFFAGCFESQRRRHCKHPI